MVSLGQLARLRSGVDGVSVSKQPRYSFIAMFYSGLRILGHGADMILLGGLSSSGGRPLSLGGGSFSCPSSDSEESESESESDSDIMLADFNSSLLFTGL